MLSKGDADTAIQELYAMVSDPKIEVAVRQGDIFATMVEHFAANGNFKSALGTLQEMKNRLPQVINYTDKNCLNYSNKIFISSCALFTRALFIPESAERIIYKQQGNSTYCSFLVNAFQIHFYPSSGL